VLVVVPPTPFMAMWSIGVDTPIAEPTVEFSVEQRRMVTDGL